MHVPTDRPLGEWIRELADEGKLYAFYNSVEWKALRAEVMRDHGNECESCAARGEYVRATTVHHEYEVKKHPSMALTRWMEQPDGSMREVLHPLCEDCHNAAHDRYCGARKKTKKSKPVTAERWD